MAEQENMPVPKGEFNLMASTNSLLNELGVKLEGNPHQEKLVSFFSTRVFDRGSISPLPPQNQKDLDKAEVEADPSLNTGRLDGVPVLSSGMAKLLTTVGYDVKDMIDIKNLFGANSLSWENGNRLIRQVVAYVDKNYPECKIVRWSGGDEFLIMGKVGASYDRSVLEGLTSQKLVYALNGGYEKHNISVEAKNFTPSLIETQYKSEGKDIKTRVAELRHYHEELAYITNEDFGKNSGEKVIELLERSLYHPFLHEKAQELSKKIGMNIEVYKDEEDYIRHLPSFPNDNAELIRIEWPGTLKRIHETHTEGGYNAGNEFLERNLELLCNYIKLKGKNMDGFKLLCRGSDFHTILPSGLVNKNELHGLFPQVDLTSKSESKTIQLTTAVGTALVDSGFFSEKDMKTKKNTFYMSLERVQKDLKLDHYTALLEKWRKYKTGEIKKDVFEEEIDKYFISDKRAIFRLQSLLRVPQLKEIGVNIDQVNKVHILDLNKKKLYFYLERAMRTLHVQDMLEKGMAG